MGYSVPAAMGAKVGEPDRVVWAIDGDGCFQMTNQELATCVINDIPDQGRHHQQLVPRHGAPVADPLLRGPALVHRSRDTGHDSRRMIPDFVKLADAYGALGIRVRTEGRRGRRRPSSSPSRPTTGPSSSTSWSAATRWCGRWFPQGVSNSLHPARPVPSHPTWDDEAPGGGDPDLQGGAGSTGGRA